MRLCFGTFATILNHCRQNITQADFIAKIVNIVDPDRYHEKDIARDGPAISKLLSCKIDFAFLNGTADILSLDTVIEHFETDISHFIDEDKKKKLIITLLNLIKNDNCIDSEKKESFIKYFGSKKQELLQQSSFGFSDLLGKALLYTVYGNINNQVGKEYVQIITDDYINNTAKPYTHELYWDFNKQALTLLHVQMFQIFNEALTKTQLFEFINSISFSAIMNFNRLKAYDDFMDDIHDHILIPFGLEQTGWTFSKIEQFIQIFLDYTNDLESYICCMTYFSQDFNPQSEENGQPQALFPFTKELESYRKQLIDIYYEILDHMPYA